jgi:hypothetical protein
MPKISMFGARKKAAMPFVPGTASQDKAVGWMPARGQAHGVMAESVNGQWMLRFMVDALDSARTVALERTGSVYQQALFNAQGSLEKHLAKRPKPPRPKPRN